VSQLFLIIYFIFFFIFFFKRILSRCNASIFAIEFCWNLVYRDTDC